VYWVTSQLRHFPESAPDPFSPANGSWIRATPALDGDRLYVAGMKDVLVCLDVESGTILWKLDFVNDTGSPLPDFGFISSPLVHD
jgi:outer membrane protein assembly factor BamB